LRIRLASRFGDHSLVVESHIAAELSPNFGDGLKDQAAA